MTNTHELRTHTLPVNANHAIAELQETTYRIYNILQGNPSRQFMFTSEMGACPTLYSKMSCARRWLDQYTRH